MRPRAPSTVSVVLLVGVLAAGSCSGDDEGESVPTIGPPPTASATTSPGSTSPPTTSETATTVALAPARWRLRPGPTQLAVLRGEPGERLQLVTAEEEVLVAEGEVDDRGSLLFRDLSPGTFVVRSETEQSEPVAVTSFDDEPEQSFYDRQNVRPGFGYVRVRDGTQLSVNVVLPGPIENGPYPTVVEYSGYDPSNPDAELSLKDLFPPLGYAYVGVNIRGSGCSGGAFGYFEPIQSYDGYDVIETIAAQPWVADGRVGMVGISYSGISQLYVASTRPPSLEAITPLSPVDDSGRFTLYPGGILNDGFALDWTRERDAETAPFGQPWTKARADGGDEICGANQDLRLQNMPLEEMVFDNPFYTPEIGDDLAPRLLLGEINVPVMIAGSWQDEQTGAHFATMLDEFTGTDRVFATLTNGLHADSLTPGVFARYVEFLELYVARRTPWLAPARLVTPVLASGLYGTDQVSLRDDRFIGVEYDEALATFEADPAVQVLFEQGAADFTAPRTPMPRFVADFAAWPVPDAEPTSWYLGADAALTDRPPTSAGTTSYVADPGNAPETYYDAESGSIWSVDATYDWRREAPGTAARFRSAPFAEDTIVMGSGSADLWMESSAPDTDVEVTITELRSDDTETLVQSGWLRASHRALDPSLSTELEPMHTHAEADAQELPPGELTPIRVDIFPFAHPFRAGSRLQVTIDAPGGNRQIWRFDTVSEGETVTIAHDAEHPSRIVLSTLTGIDIPDALPECGSLRGQPCR